MVDNPYKIAGNILSASLESDYNFRSVDLYGSSVRGKEDSLCSEFHLENESGTGDIAMYQIFPGMELVYNDMHMEYCNKAQSPHFGLIEINYCREDAVNVHLENIAIVIWLPVIYPFVPYRENHIPRHFLLLIIME